MRNANAFSPLDNILQREDVEAVKMVNHLQVRQTL